MKSEAPEAGMQVPKLYQGVDTGSLAFRLLSSMGWKEGEGLGAKKQGITEHVRVKKKSDALGVGAAEQASRLRDWTTGMLHFDRVLSGLKEVTAARETGADSSKGEQHQAGKKKAKTALPKEAARKAAVAAVMSHESESEIGDSGSSSGDESARCQRPAAKVATHVGRYHRRERGKLVRGYSDGDLAAILGAPQGASGGPAEVRAARPTVDSDSDEEDADALPRGGLGAAAGAAGAPAAAAAEAAAAAAPESVSRSWWSSLFVRSGRMGSTRKELHSKRVMATAAAKAADAGALASSTAAAAAATAAAAAAAAAGGAAIKSIKVSGFSEQDQENLYEKVQHGAVHGKQGLGRADAPKKVAGARWCGTKTKLDSDDDDDVDDDDAGGRGLEEEAGSSSSSDDEAAVVVLASKQEQAEGHVRKEVLGTVQDQSRAKSPEQSTAAAAESAAVATAAAKAARRKRKITDQSSLVVIEGKCDVPDGMAAERTDKAGKRGLREGDDGAPQGRGRRARRGQEQQQQQQQQQQPEATGKALAAESTKAGKVRWKKLAHGLLKEAPKQRLKHGLLRRRVLRAAGLCSDALGGAECKMLRKLRCFPELFNVGDKFVCLA